MSHEPEILKLADQCVKCGLCLPHCPTYRLSQDENESPRGRIALLQGLAMGQLKPEPHLNKHIAQCLACRNCERVCPAGVQYENLLDLGRQYLTEHSAATPQPRKWRQKLATIPANKRSMRGLCRILLFYQRSGIQTLLRASGLLKLLGLKRLDGLLPALNKATAYRPHYSAQGEERGRVALFIGCLGETLDQTTYSASIKVLVRLGYRVEVVQQQTCCGAIAAHSGDKPQARQLAAQNLAAFDPDSVDAIVFCASGCGAQLNRYTALFPNDKNLFNKANVFQAKLQELTTFLNQVKWPESIRFKPVKLDIASHTPCTQLNALRQPSVSSQLLNKVAGYQVVELAGNDQCCGAAGTYMLEQGKIADRLRQMKLDAIKASGIETIVTTNPGCRLFMQAGSKSIRIVHPVVLLAEALLDK